MRIVGGSARGRAIKAPPGSRGPRPTSDRAREAIFNILAHGPKEICGPGVDGAAIADVFAGTGAMGLEALSRGAANAVFINNDGAAIACCRKNAAAIGKWRNVVFLKLDAAAPPPPPLAAKAPCAYAFLDPPYESGLLIPALTGLTDKGWIGAGSICVAETSAKEVFEPPRGFQLLDQRTYGAAKVSFLKKD